MTGVQTCALPIYVTNYTECNKLYIMLQTIQNVTNYTEGNSVLCSATQVMRHLTKLFDSMAKLEFEKEGEENTKIAKVMISKDGEVVQLAHTVDCDGQVSLIL